MPTHHGLALAVLIALAPSSGLAQSPAPVVTYGSKSDYARALERQLLSAGISVDVFVRPNDQMMLFGYWDKAAVFLIASRLNILPNAQRQGFRSVDFYDKGREGHFTFDIPAKGTIPSCARFKRVCL